VCVCECGLAAQRETVEVRLTTGKSKSQRKSGGR